MKGDGRILIVNEKKNVYICGWPLDSWWFNLLIIEQKWYDFYNYQVTIINWGRVQAFCVPNLQRVSSFISMVKGEWVEKYHNFQCSKKNIHLPLVRNWWCLCKRGIHRVTTGITIDVNHDNCRRPLKYFQILRNYFRVLKFGECSDVACLIIKHKIALN